MVFQSYALYPYLTVAQNIGFPLKMARVARSERDRRVREVAELLELSDLLERKPGQLSGGQRQRVAMGRAIVREPSVYLMDEPLSNLDAKLRVQMRADIAALQARLGVTTVYVTHDQSEAMTLGSRVAVLQDGQLQQCAPPRELYERPANAFVAGFIGSPAMSLVEVPLGANGVVRPRRRSGAPADGDGCGRIGAWSDARARRPPRRVAADRGRRDPGRGRGGRGARRGRLRLLHGRDRGRRDEADRTRRGTPRAGAWEAVRLEPQGGDAHLFDPVSGERLLPAVVAVILRCVYALRAMRHARQLARCGREADAFRAVPLPRRHAADPLVDSCLADNRREEARCEMRRTRTASSGRGPRTRPSSAAATSCTPPARSHSTRAAARCRRDRRADRAGAREPRGLPGRGRLHARRRPEGERLPRRPRRLRRIQRGVRGVVRRAVPRAHDRAGRASRRRSASRSRRSRASRRS